MRSRPGIAGLARGLAPIHRRAAAAVAAVAVSAVTLAGAAPALAGIQHDYAAFASCPVNSPGVTTCLLSLTEGGEFHIGSKTVPIDKTITLQGGLAGQSGPLVAPVGAETLSKTPLQLPGGLIGVELLGSLTEVNATAELAGPVIVNLSNSLSAKGTAVSLPLKLKLSNALLGESCYLGSSSSPVDPQLTTGTTSPPSGTAPISGNKGTLTTARDGIDTLTGVALVDNAFSVPGAQGCGGLLSFLIDPSVDLIAGVPAAAGHNTAILDDTVEITTSRLVKAEQALPEVGHCERVKGVREEGVLVYHADYLDAGCVEESPSDEGPYEWTPGPGSSAAITSKGGAAVLETLGRSQVRCTASSGSGEYTGTRTAKLAVSFTGCKVTSSKEACQSPGASAGEIVTGTLSGTLGFTSDTEAGVGVGLDLTREPQLISAECGSAAAKLSVTGSVIGPLVKIDAMAPSETVAFAATEGRQAPEAFEEGARDVLTSKLGGGAAEQAGLTSKVLLKTAGRLEVKAEA